MINKFFFILSLSLSAFAYAQSNSGNATLNLEMQVGVITAGGTTWLGDPAQDVQIKLVKIGQQGSYEIYQGVWSKNMQVSNQSFNAQVDIVAQLDRGVVLGYEVNSSVAPIKVGTTKTYMAVKTLNEVNSTTIQGKLQNDLKVAYIYRLNLRRPSK